MEFLRSVNRIEDNFKQKKVSIENIKVIDVQEMDGYISQISELKIQKLSNNNFQNFK